MFQPLQDLIWTLIGSAYGPNFLQQPWLQLVNLGKRDEPKWYPAEKLRVLAYQKYKGVVPSTVSAAMITTACQTPLYAKALVGVEGLETLGVPRDLVLSGNGEFPLVSLNST